MFTITKLAVTAILIVLISEVGKLNDKLGGLIAALPLVTIFVVCWMYFEGVSENKIANHFKYTILFLIPTLPGFFIVPFIKRFDFKFHFKKTAKLCRQNI